MHTALGNAQDAAQRAEHAEAQQRTAEAAAEEARAASDIAQHARLAAESGLADAEQEDERGVTALGTMQHLSWL